MAFAHFVALYKHWGHLKTIIKWNLHSVSFLLKLWSCIKAWKVIISAIADFTFSCNDWKQIWRHLQFWRVEPFEKLMTAGMGQTRFHSLRSLESIVHGGLWLFTQLYVAFLHLKVCASSLMCEAWLDTRDNGRGNGIDSNGFILWGGRKCCYLKSQQCHKWQN